MSASLHILPCRMPPWYRLPHFRAGLVFLRTLASLLPALVPRMSFGTGTTDLRPLVLVAQVLPGLQHAGVSISLTRSAREALHCPSDCHASLALSDVARSTEMVMSFKMNSSGLRKPYIGCLIDWERKGAYPTFCAPEMHVIAFL